MIQFSSRVQIYGIVMAVYENETYFNEKYFKLRIGYKNTGGKMEFINAMCFGQIVQSVKEMNPELKDIAYVDGELTSYEKLIGDKKVTLYSILVNDFKIVRKAKCRDPESSEESA